MSIETAPSIANAGATAGTARPPGGAPEPLALRANKLELLERLADDLAHEIKNPLHSMVINLEVLKRRVAKLEGAGHDDVQRYIGVLAGELERVNRRIELLLRLARPGRGAESASLAELTEELMELIQLEARHRELAVAYDPGALAARVFAQREAARQVILNLVLEAVERLEGGGTLRLSIGERDGRSLLRVGGDGEGAAAVLAEALDGGERMEVARALAERMGGRVEAEEGALVFSLPAGR
ncbi:MAG TPA: HAMP domain-containing sensor histidine kinase [Longimicrobium sp.]|nr:HAMP domain-containing sensor histidine kinase [Longimicrobium sp.]